VFLVLLVGVVISELAAISIYPLPSDSKLVAFQPLVCGMYCNKKLRICVVVVPGRQ
jgi:hypothetical protein